MTKKPEEKQLELPEFWDNSADALTESFEVTDAMQETIRSKSLIDATGASWFLFDLTKNMLGLDSGKCTDTVKVMNYGVQIMLCSNARGITKMYNIADACVIRPTDRVILAPSKEHARALIEYAYKIFARDYGNAPPTAE